VWDVAKRRAYAIKRDRTRDRGVWVVMTVLAAAEVADPEAIEAAERAPHAARAVA
jgi:hypothetical protein